MGPLLWEAPPMEGPLCWKMTLDSMSMWVHVDMELVVLSLNMRVGTGNSCDYRSSLDV